MSAYIATLVYSALILGLFWLDRDRTSRASPALLLPVMWLALPGSRSPSEWLYATRPALTAETLLEGVWPKFKATVVNSGTLDALTWPDGVGFRVELYIKTSPSDPPGWPSDHEGGYCLDGCTTLRYQYVADVSQLPMGEPVDVWFESLNLDPTPDFPAAGTYDIYVQVDVAFEGDNLYWGRFQESNEENNILKHTITLTPFDPDYVSYLPLVFRTVP